MDPQKWLTHTMLKRLCNSRGMPCIPLEELRKLWLMVEIIAHHELPARCDFC